MGGTPYFNEAGVFLIRTVFGFCLLALMLRFLLQWVRADFYNPLVQFLVAHHQPAAAAAAPATCRACTGSTWPACC